MLHARHKLSELKEHCDSLNAKYASMEEQLDRAKEQAATLTRKVEKVRSHNARLISLTEGANNKEAIDEEIREEELLELRKARNAVIVALTVMK